MSDGAESSACEGSSLATLRPEDERARPEAVEEEPPPRTATTYTGRRPRFGTGNVPTSPFVWIDGRKLRSALAYTKKWPPRRVSFPTNDTHLVTGYLEPANPWRHAENVNHGDLISAYKESCIRHNTVPLESVLAQLENLDISEERSEVLCLKGETLDQNNAEPLEEILKRVQFKKIDLEGTSLDDESSVILFDMIEYYESAKHVNISCNQKIGIRGWQACSHMIKKTQCLEQLEAKDVTLNEQYMNILSRALRLVCHLHILKLENCGLSGRAIIILVTALKMNTGIRELYLADNGLDLYDAIQLGSLLRLNNRLQLLDISNNNIQDDGVRDILEGLINQVNEDKDGKGLNILVLWNNRLTKKSSPHFSRIIALSKTLETLNIGQNTLTDEMLITVKDPLKKNRTLLQLGMQSTDLTCEGVIALSEIIETNEVLQRIDLRDNSIQMTGMKALSAAMKKNKNITQVDLDQKPRIKIDGTLHQYMDLVAEIRSCCARNEETRSTNENSEDSESPHHYSRFCSASSRKISLTCQTLPCSPPPPPTPMTPIPSDESGRSMLEPKRTSGGRLRSPAPSPIPSPVASPIPSPSRSRFVVSKVSEASLRSTDSSASSSPVTPPSLEPLSTCFFPAASGSSRFRVSIVESASTVPSSASVVASPKNNVTIGFNFKIDTVDSTDSDDSDNVFKSELKSGNDQTVRNSDITSDKFNVSSGTVTNENSTPSTNEISNAKGTSTNHQCLADGATELKPQESGNDVTSEYKEHCDKRDNQSNVSNELENVVPTENIKKEEAYRNESTKDTQINVNVNEDNVETRHVVVSDTSTNVHPEHTAVKQTANSSVDKVKESQAKKSSFVQKHTSSIEKLLSLFQHPGSLFSDSSSSNQVDSKNPLQDSMHSMMAFGDKFHQYFREPKGPFKSNTEEESLSHVSSSPMKSKQAKSLNISQLSSLQSLTNMFASFKFDSNVNSTEQNITTCSNETENASHFCEEKNDDAEDSQTLRTNAKVCSNENTRFTASSNEQNVNVSNVDNRSLPEDVQSKDNDGHTSKDLVLEGKRVAPNTLMDACSEIINNATLTHVPESKMTVRIPKLKDIPEYSVLEISENTVKGTNLEYELMEATNSVAVEKTCDRSPTDSITLTSDSNSSSCNITCDIRVIDSVNTVSMLEQTSSDSKNDTEDISVFSTHDERNKISPYVCEENCNHFASVSPNPLDTPEPNAERSNGSNEVTGVCTDSNRNEDPVSPHNATSEDETATCRVDDGPHWKSTTVNNKLASSIAEMRLAPKDSSNNFYNEDAHRSPEISEEFAQQESEMTASNTSQRSPFKDTEFSESFVASDDSFKETPVFVPTVILPCDEEPADTPLEKEFFGDFEKMDSEDLIFCMTDISADGISVEEELSPGVASISSSCSNDLLKTANRDVPRVPRSPTNLLIEESESMHRNSQDSGIGETSLSTLDDNISERSHTRESFQESVDSGIESECFPCMKVDVEKAKVSKGGPGESASVRINEFAGFELDSIDSADDLTHPYLGHAAVTSAYSVPGIGIKDTAPIGIIAEESGTVITESTTVIQAASPK